MTNKEPNTSGLLKTAAEKKEKALKKVDEAIKAMIKNQSRINFQSVAERSGVSKTYLYKNKAIRSRIINLRNQQEGLSNPKHVKRNMSDNSKDILIESLRRKVKELEKERDQLNEQLKRNLGKFYDNI
jgi:predicted nuclease with TOPRIM domain